VIQQKTKFKHSMLVTLFLLMNLLTNFSYANGMFSGDVDIIAMFDGSYSMYNNKLETLMNISDYGDGRFISSLSSNIRLGYTTLGSNAPDAIQAVPKEMDGSNLFTDQLVKGFFGYSYEINNTSYVDFYTGIVNVLESSAGAFSGLIVNSSYTDSFRYTEDSQRIIFLITKQIEIHADESTISNANNLLTNNDISIYAIIPIQIKSTIIDEKILAVKRHSDGTLIGYYVKNSMVYEKYINIEDVSSMDGDSSYIHTILNRHNSNGSFIEGVVADIHELEGSYSDFNQAFIMAATGLYDNLERTCTCAPSSYTYGNIKDTVTLANIPNVTITSTKGPSEFNEQTDMSGLYIAYIQPGTYTVSVSAEGYITSTEIITVDESLSRQRIDFKLTPINKLTMPTPPILSMHKVGLQLRGGWPYEVGIEGYKLYYAPFPYTGPDSIKSVDLGDKLSFVYNLNDGDSYYIAVKAYNKTSESDFSNIELFSIKF